VTPLLEVPVDILRLQTDFSGTVPEHMNRTHLMQKAKAFKGNHTHCTSFVRVTDEA